MPRLVKIPIEEARQVNKKVRRATILEEYKSHIESLAPSEAGQFKIKDTREGFKLWARLKRASKDLGVNVTVQKRGNYLRFWREE